MRDYVYCCEVASKGGECTCQMDDLLALDEKHRDLWTAGIPSIEAVADHEYYGGNWIYISEHFPRHPGFLRLRVRCTNLNLDTHIVEMQNGHTFWQPLAECNWAAGCKYRPVDNGGFVLGGAE